jgi:membrane protease YdiL (CAAX protease family)
LQPATRPPNPYRQILARRFPEPFLAFLLFLFGIWLWDHYFGRATGYASGTGEMALVRIDRDIRLAEQMGGSPPLLRRLLDISTPAAVLADAAKTLPELERSGALDEDQRIEATVILLAAKGRLSPAALAEYGFDRIPSQAGLGQAITSGHGAWWQAALARSWEKQGEFASRVSWDAYGASGRHLLWRACAGRGAVWLVVLGGLPFLPRALRMLCIRSAPPNKYAGAWKPSLGLVVFLLSTLAWIGFTMALEFLAAAHSFPRWYGIALDSACRVLPVLIAIALLFRKGRHAVRSFGADRPVPWRMVLGVFAGLSLADRAITLALGGLIPVDPTGGLSASEHGIWGLVYASVSACLLAPLTEEVLYRGVLFRSLANGSGLWIGAAISSAFFALVHFYNLYGLISVALFGFATALTFASSRCITAAIALHMLYNASIKLPEWLVYHSANG